MPLIRNFVLRHALFVTVLLAFGSVLPAQAADGDFDASFRGNGRFLSGVASLGGKAAAVAPDGRLLIGYTAVLSGTDRDMRVMPVPDAGITTFCGDFHPDLGGTNEDRLADIGVYNGRVYLAGRAAGPPGDTDSRIAIAAFDLANCTLWTGFGGATGLLLDSMEAVETVAIGIDLFGAVRGAVQHGPAGGRDLISLGLDPAGAFADALNIDFVSAYGANSFEPKAIALQPDGKRVVVGTMVLPGGDRDVGVVRLTANGNLDATFSDDGLLGFAYDIIDGGNDEGLAVAIVPGGRIVVAGSVERSIGTQAAVAVLTPTGGYFNDFGVIGRYSFDMANPDRMNVLRAVALQGDGKIVVAGSTGPVPPATDSDFAVARLLLTGDAPIDSTFGSGGRRMIAFDEGGTLADAANDLTLGQGGRIAVVGAVATASGTALGAVRLTNAYIFADGFEWGSLLGTEWQGNWGGGSS